MSTSRPEIIFHDAFRPLSHEFFQPYPPYILVNSREDAESVCSAGCEPGYLLILDVQGPSGAKSLKSNDIGEFQGCVGIVIYALPIDVDLSMVASLILGLLSIDGTAIGYATPQQSAQWKEACLKWAKAQKTEGIQGREQDSIEQDSIVLEWSSKDAKGDEWVQWSVTKKAPEWAFC
ncbi:unnamed protein product [Rhizoctonia solani]|uniref:Uncharacterized protein n=1 Tax=Rhizoctonia solani TaxID=456999 RepID=A0A8H3B057_9AGAM|nr:unnamed protein product [Rhizoctonia solani]